MTNSRKDGGLVSKTVQIVRTVASYPDGVGLSDTARDTGLSKATCFRILSTLEDEGWLQSDPVSRQFKLSFDLFMLVSSQHTAERRSALIDEVLQTTASNLEETTGIDHFDEQDVVVLREFTGPHQIGHTPRAVPRRLSAVRSSTGRIMLAHGDRTLATELFNKDKSDTTSVAVAADSQAFNSKLDEVIERGYALSSDELEDGLTAIAVPVWHGNDVSYSLWVSGPSFRMRNQQREQTVSTLKKAARQISVLLHPEEDIQPFPRD